MSEKSIIEGIRSGDRAAMHTLYDMLSGYALATAMRYLGNHADAEDVTHDSFVKVFTQFHHYTYRGSGSLKAWVLRIVANESVNYLRRNSKLVFTDQIPDDKEENPPDITPIPPNVLTKMISTLPTGYRTVLNLFVFEQKSHKEISSLLGIKESTSASQYLRAKKMLAHMINEYTRSHE